MPIKLDKKESVFRNELIFAADAKAVTLDNTLTNLFMLIRQNGNRVKVRVNKEQTFDTIRKYFEELEKQGSLVGFVDNMDAANDWVRSNLVNLVNRGNIVKEKISSLRPIHLESFKLRNLAHTRDYNTADQIYLMLRKQPEVLAGLREYLSKGWDDNSKEISKNQQLDVDSVGILHLIKKIELVFKSSPAIKTIHPLLEGQADLFCNDVLRLLFYRDALPRNVFIEYLRILIGFHLSLYTQKTIALLPKMIKEGNLNVTDDWSVIADVTDNLDSNISRFACEDMAKSINGLYEYFKATYQINAVCQRPEFAQKQLEGIDEILYVLNKRPPDFEPYFQSKFSTVISNLDEDDKEEVYDFVQYDDSYFDKYIQTLLKARGAYQYKYYIQFLDNISMKNSDYGFMADGRSRRHSRRAVLGSRLLEMLIQLLVLEPKKEGTFCSRSLSIDELISRLRSRYGIIINGLTEKRFENADVQTHLAFKENVEAFKNKLRQIGFYSDLSDAYILQKIRPRYKFEA
jgi:hypothetical protein